MSSATVAERSRSQQFGECGMLNEEFGMNGGILETSEESDSEQLAVNSYEDSKHQRGLLNC